MMSSNRERQEDHDRELRKKAIMLGLNRFLSVEQCIAAVAIWEQGYSRASGYALQGFINDLASSNEKIWSSRNDIFNHLMKVVSQPAEIIEDEFQKQFDAAIDFIALEEDDEESQAQRIFEAIYQQLMASLESENYAISVQLRKFLREKMLQGTTFNMETQRLNSWLLGLKDQLDIVLPVERMREILHLAYLGSCEYLGPVEADRLLEETVSAVETKTRGEGFSPRDLL